MALKRRAILTKRRQIDHSVLYRRLADMDCFLEVEMRTQRREIVGVVVHVMAVTGLGGANMAAPVVRNDAIAVLEEEHGIQVRERAGT